MNIKRTKKKTPKTGSISILYVFISIGMVCWVPMFMIYIQQFANNQLISRAYAKIESTQVSPRAPWLPELHTCTYLTALNLEWESLWLSTVWQLLRSGEMPLEDNWRAQRRHTSRANPYAKCRVTQPPKTETFRQGVIEQNWFFFLALLHLKRHLNDRKMTDEQPCKTSARINKWETPFTNPI